mmetsp:Transcript_17435/g.37860  ORF Transcript_17435/g.37860 Transcript_17435/m.37860 type:complete len:244 (-) Transcript_17435:203-934(-)
MGCGFVNGGGLKPAQRAGRRADSVCTGTNVERVVRFARHQGARRCVVVGMAKEVEFGELNGSSLRIGIVRSRWNSEMVDAMRKDVRETLLENKVEEDNIVEVTVPGSWELPLAARYMSITQKLDAIVVLGVLVKGDTTHYEAIVESVSSALMDLQMSSVVPVVFGVLTCLTEEQASARSLGDKSHASDWARTAIEMALLRASQMGKQAGNASSKSVGFGMLPTPDSLEKSSDSEEEPAKKIGF